MAFHNINWTSISLPAGTYQPGDIGDGLSASTIHQLYCLATGTVTVFPRGGGSFTWSATTNDKMDVVVGSCVVNSGLFVGFKTAFQANWNQQNRIQ